MDYLSMKKQVLDLRLQKMLMIWTLMVGKPMAFSKTMITLCM